MTGRVTYNKALHGHGTDTVVELLEHFCPFTEVHAAPAALTNSDNDINRARHSQIVQIANSDEQNSPARDFPS